MDGKLEVWRMQWIAIKTGNIFILKENWSLKLQMIMCPYLELRRTFFSLLFISFSYLHGYCVNNTVQFSHRWWASSPNAWSFQITGGIWFISDSLNWWWQGEFLSVRSNWHIQWIEWCLLRCSENLKKKLLGGVNFTQPNEKLNQ